MAKTKVNNLKAAPVSQRSFAEVKGKNLILHSLKTYSSGLKRDDTFTVSPALLAKAKTLAKRNDYKGFKVLLKNAGGEEALKIGSRHEKSLECKHARVRNHLRNPIAKHINWPAGVVEYGKAKTGKVAKVKVKKTKATKKSKAVKKNQK